MRKMKKSSVEWIGNIPECWICCKQKYLIKLINGRAYDESEFEINGKYRVLRVGNLYTNPVWYTSSLELPEEKYCNTGDLLYSWSMSYSPVIWMGEKVIYHYHIWKTKLSNDLEKKFAYYYLLSLTDAILSEVHETTMGFITMGVMNRSYIVYPDILNQKRIANFLDEKCEMIDSLVVNIQSQIDTLEEYKKSVITEAVTKGLNPDVELKDSGIEWIGEIPCDWTLCKIKHVCSLIGSGTTPTSGCLDFYDGGEINWIQSGDIYGKSRINDVTTLITKKALMSSPALKVYSAPFIVIAMYGGSVGNTAISEISACTNQACCCLKTNDSTLLKYLYYWIEICKHDFLYLAEGGGQPNISQNKIKNQYFVKPSIDIQERIVNYLDTKCSEIDAVISEKKEQLSTLAEYKKSLIYEYVTGKKEVAAA